MSGPDRTEVLYNLLLEHGPQTDIADAILDHARRTCPSVGVLMSDDRLAEQELDEMCRAESARAEDVSIAVGHVVRSVILSRRYSLATLHLILWGVNHVECARLERAILDS